MPTGHVDALNAHDAAPAGLEEPAAQGIGEEEAGGQKDPAGQGTETPPEQYEPAGHKTGEPEGQ